MSAHNDLPTWTVRGRRKDRLIRIDVTQPPGETVTVNYTDPDGAPAVCRNTERAHAVITPAAADLAGLGDRAAVGAARHGPRRGRHP